VNEFFHEKGSFIYLWKETKNQWVSSDGVPLKEIDGSSCCVSNNFGPKFNNEPHMHKINYAK
jgi:hypothetical protein